MSDTKAIRNTKTRTTIQKNSRNITPAQIKKMMKMRVITSPDQIKPRKNQEAVNKRNLEILETKIFGQLRLEEGETVMGLLGRE